MNNMVSRFHLTPSDTAQLVSWMIHHRECFPEKVVYDWKISPHCLNRPSTKNIDNVKLWLDKLLNNPREFAKCKSELYRQFEDGFQICQTFLYVLTEHYSNFYTYEEHLKLLTEIFFKLIDIAKKRRNAVQIKLIL